MPTTLASAEPYYRNGEGVYLPETPITHRDDEYDPAAFDLLLRMQARHFWYQGRHRFLYRALRRSLGRNESPGAAVDLGGGCGGWVKYLLDRQGAGFRELALADSSLCALEYAQEVLNPDTRRYQIDLLDLKWEQRWDVAFLLDVLEHIPQDEAALRQIYRALRPGGLLLVTTPALKFFWSYNDDIVHHVRRYSRGDFQRLAAACGFKLQMSRYFMFLLSPLLMLSRLRRPRVEEMTPAEIRELLQRTHRVPAAPVNQALRMVFSAETPLGLWTPFPWGTSVLGVFQKPH